MAKDNSINGKLKQIQKLIKLISKKVCCDIEIPKINSNLDYNTQIKEAEKLVKWLKAKINECCNSSSSLYTSFFVGPTPQSECFAVLEEETLQLWHNGTGLFPELGDVVYSDAAGTTVFVTEGLGTYWCDGVSNNELKTDINGIVVTLDCK